MSAHPSPSPDTGELTVDQLAAAADVPVRRIRFYTGKRLLPPPRLDGRTGLYGDAHLARLRLIAELQDAGYTLAAIEEFLSSVPPDADAQAVTLVGALVAPGSPGPAVVLDRAQLESHLGRAVTDDQLAALERAHLLRLADDGAVRMTTSQLDFTRRLVAVDAPLDAMVEAGLLVRRHARALAEDLQDVFERRVLAQYDDPTPAERERLRELSRALRPLTIQAIVTAYQEALDEVVREGRAGSDVATPSDAAGDASPGG